MFKNLIAEHQKASLVGRLISLQQQQRTVFTDVQAMEDSENTEVEYNMNEVQNAIISIQTQLETCKETEKLAEVQQVLTPQEIHLQQIILADTSALALQPEARLPLMAQVESVRQAENQLLDQVFINHANSPINIEITAPSEIQRLVTRGINISGLATKLRTLMSEILRNNPDVFRYSRTNEGMKVMDHPLSSHEVMEIQNTIQEQIEMLATPEILAAYHKALPPQKAILEVRLISHLLDLLSGKNGNEILNDSTIDSSEDALMSTIASEQLRLTQEKPQEVKLPSLVNTHRDFKVEHFILDTLSRLDLIQRLGFLQSQQASISPHATSGICDPDVTAIQSPAIINRELPKIYAQLEAINEPDKLIPLIQELTPENLQAEQQMLLQAISIISSPDNLNSLSDAGKITKVANKKAMSKLQQVVMKRELDLLYAEPEKIDFIEISASTAPVQSLTKVDYATTCASKSIDLATLLSVVSQNSPQAPKAGKEAKDIISKNLNAKKLTESNETLDELNYMMQTSPEDIPFYIQELEPVDQTIVYSLISDQLKALKEKPHGDFKVNDMSMSQRVFDHASLIQRTPGTIKAGKMPDLSSIPARIEESKKDIAKKNVCDQLVALQRQRLSAAPGIVEASKSDMINNLSVTPETIKAAQNAVLAQIHLLSQPEQLKAEIVKFKPEELVLQQIVASDALQLAEVDEVINPIIEGIDFKKTEPLSVTASDKTIGSLFANQADTFRRSPLIVKQVKLEKSSELAKSNQEALEQKERAKLNNQLVTAIKAVTEVSPDAVKTIKSKKITEPIEIEEICQLQEIIRTLINNPENTKTALDGKNAQTVAKLIICMDDMAQTIKPVTQQEKKKVQDIESLGIDSNEQASLPENFRPISIFEQPVVIPEEALVVKPLEIKPPTMPEVLSQLVTAANNVVEVVPLISTLPMKDVKEMLIKDTEQTINICDKLLQSNDTKYLPDVTILIELCPELVATMSRVLPTIEKSARAELPSDPSCLITTISDIQRSALELTDEAKAKKYRESINSLYSTMKKMNGVLVDACIDPVLCASNIVAAAKRNDITTLNAEVANFEAAKIKSLSTGQNKKQIEKIDAIIQQISPTVKTISSTPTQSKKPSASAITESIPQLIKLIAKESENPFAEMEKIAKTSDVPTFVDVAIPKIELSSATLSRAVASADRTGADDAIEQLIRSTTDSQAALLKGIDLKGVDSVPVYMDFVSNLNTSMSSLGSILSATKTASATPVSLKRCQRTLSRVMNQMKEQLASKEKSKDSGKNSKLEGKKLDFIKGAVSTVQSMITTLSARASSKVPENFNAIFQKQLPTIKSNIEQLKASGSSLTKANSDKSSGAEFNRELDALLQTFNTFTDSVNSTENLDIVDIAGSLIDVSTKLASTVGTVSRMSDKTAGMPDIANSEKIPSRFNLPPVPTDTSGLKAVELNQEISQLISDYKDSLSDFQKKSLSSKAPNSELAELLLALNDKLRIICIKALCISTCANNFQLQNDIARDLNTIVLQFNVIIRTLRSRFLLSCPDWEGTIPTLTKNLSDTCMSVSSTAKKISDEESANEEFKKLFGLKFTQALGPLTSSLNALTSDSEISKSLPEGPHKEWSSNMLEIGIKLGDSVMKVFKYLKEHPSKKMKPDSILDFATVLTHELISLDQHAQSLYSKSGEPEQHASDALRSIAKLGKVFTDSVTGIDIPGLKDAVVSLCKAAGNTADSADAALKKRVKKSTSAAAASKINEVIEVMSEEDLMKRLILESKVIKARLYLGRFEKKLSSLQ